MSITQKFYDSMASHYDKLFLDWNATTKEQAVLPQEIEELTALFTAHGCEKVIWMFPEETEFYQPIIVAIK